jgi:hypothetical protein
MRINRTSGPVFGILAALLPWILLGGLSSAQASCRIENISLERAGKFTKVTLYADQPWEMVHSTEPAKDGKPYRVIIDCRDALFALPQNNFEQGLPAGTIQRIRTSQYQAVPERIVRVVLDLKGSAIYKVLETTDKRKATIALLTAQDPDFPMWTAVTGKGTPGAMVKNQTPAAPTQKTAWSEPAWPRTLSYADTGENVVTSGRQTALSRPAVSSQPERQAAKAVGPVPGKATTVTADAGQSAAGSTAKITKMTKSPLPLGPATERQSPADQGTGNQVESARSAERLVSGPTSSGKAEEAETRAVLSSHSRQTPAQRTPRRRRINRSSTPLGPYAEELAVTRVSQPGGNAKSQKEPTEVAERPAGGIVEGIGKILGPESVVAKETHLAPESLMVAQEGARVELELSPRRKVVTYHPGTKKDPFVPLTEKRDMTFGVAPLPLFDNLKLVGILQDKAGNRALLEDEMGWGYILMAGDRIRNGYVISVEDDKATFQVEEYGGYHTMVLELNPE